MDPIHSKYHSYLLRLWQVREETGSHWRASLEDVQTGELQGFADLAEPLHFLERTRPGYTTLLNAPIML